MPTSREQFQAQHSVSGSTTLLPPVPYLPPPTDPKHMPAWYERFHAAMEDWREKTNQAITGATLTTENSQTQVPIP